jgi:hypothetical protein
MQVIYRCTALFCSWSSLQLLENHDWFIEVSIKLNTVRDIFIQYGWQLNFWIGPPSSLNAFCNFHVDYLFCAFISFSLFRWI